MPLPSPDKTPPETKMYFGMVYDNAQGRKSSTILGFSFGGFSLDFILFLKMILEKRVKDIPFGDNAYDNIFFIQNWKLC